MKNYKNFTDKQLHLILTNLQNVFDENNISIFDDSDLYEPETLNAIDSVVQYFGVELNDEEDYSYFISLCRLNINIEEGINRPKLQKYEVIHEEDMVEYKTYKYLSKINSYIPLNKEILNSMQANDFYQYYDGTYIDSDVYDSEIRDDEVLEIKKLK